LKCPKCNREITPVLVKIESEIISANCPICNYNMIDELKWLEGEIQWSKER
jgi:transcription elongation factor Elf1